MPTVIDSLIVELGIDGSKFKTSADKTQAVINAVGQGAVKQSKALEESLQKTQQSTDKRLRQSADVGRQTSQSFHKFRVEVAALFTTLATGFGLQSFIRNMANTEASTGRLAKNIGMSTNELSAWQEAAKRAGGSAEATGGTFQGLTQQFQQFALTGQSAVIPYFRALGVNVSDAAGEMRPMRDIMLDLADKFSKMTPQRANAFGASIGLDQGTINLLIQGREAVQGYLTQAEKLGVINEQDAKAGIAFQNSLLDLEQSLTSLGREVLTPLIPQIKEFFDSITKWVSDPAHKTLIADTAIADLKAFGTEILKIVAFIEKWQTVAEALALYIGGRWLLAMTVGLGPVGLAIAGIAASLLLVQNAMKTMDPKDFSPDSPLWGGIPEEDQLRHPQSPASRKKAGKEGENPNPFHWWNPGSWLDKPTSGAADTTMNDTKQGFLNTLAQPESGGAYNVKNGGATFSDYSQFPTGVGAGGTSSASGRYQITAETWRDLQKKYNFTDFTPETQDKAAWALANDRYRTSTGSDLETDLRSGNKSEQIAKALNPTWTSLPGGKESKQSQSTFDSSLHRNIGGASGPQFTPSKGLKENLPTEIDPSLKNWVLGSAQRDARSAGSSTSTSTVETNINGPITVTTNATDADGIARGLGASLRKYTFVSQANTGLA